MIHSINAWKWSGWSAARAAFGGASTRPTIKIRATRWLAALALVGMAAAPAGAQPVDAIWIGGTGNWNVAGNWDILTVPNELHPMPTLAPLEMCTGLTDIA